MAITFGYLGSSDGNGQWFASTVQFRGPATKSCKGLGQGDGLGGWIDSNGIYVSQIALLVGAVPQSTITWMKAIFMFTREFWSPSLSTPYSGQLYPTGGGVGGPGQVYPY